MKQHIEIEQLLHMNDEQILTLSNMVDTIWDFWQEIKHIKEARRVFEERGWKHNSLKKTAEKCGIGQMVMILNQYGKIEIESLPSGLGTIWIVSIYHGGLEINRLSFEEPELCDALWKATMKEIY